MSKQNKGKKRQTPKQVKSSVEKMLERARAHRAKAHLGKK